MKTLKFPLSLRQLFIAAAAVLFVQTSACADTPKRPVPAVEHVVIVSIDGLRPDMALRTQMPTLRSLMSEGAFTFWAKTTAVSITLPSHTSMVTGVKPDRHGITWNSDLSFTKPVYPARPTVMEMATAAGYSTAMVAGKSKFATLNKPGTINYVSVPEAVNSSVDDATVAANAEKIIAEHKPALLFVHFPGADGAGHSIGWGSDAQVAAIENIDRQLGRVIAAIDRAGLRSSTVVIVSADHGGAGRTHGADDPRSRHIPWIASGPGLKKNYDLTQLADLEVRTEDTAATTCYLLGLPVPDYFDGKPVLDAFSK